MSTDTRQVIVLCDGVFFTAVLAATDDCLHEDQDVRRQKVAQVFASRDVKSFAVLSDAVAHGQVFERIGPPIEYPNPLLLEIDEDSQEVHELKL